MTKFRDPVKHRRWSRPGQIMYQEYLHYTKNQVFPLRISSVIVTKVRRKLQIWSHLRKKSLMENFIFCPVLHNVIRFNITTTIIYSSKNFVINYLKIKIINKFLYNLQLLYFDRIDFLEGVDVSKTSKSK